MAEALKTTQFFSVVHTSGARVTEYTVPVGKRIILKHLDVTNVNGAAGTVSLGFVRSGTLYIIAYLFLPAASASIQWNGWTVLNESDQVQVDGLTGTITTWVCSGSLLYV